MKYIDFAENERLSTIILGMMRISELSEDEVEDLVEAALSIGINTFDLADIYGKPIPRYANAKEVREFMMSMMDEAEKQISYEENFEVVVKLSNYILPIMLIGILIIGIAFQTDILLALFVVSIIYIYILISQYKITKRYYKE